MEIGEEEWDATGMPARPYPSARSGRAGEQSRVGRQRRAKPSGTPQASKAEWDATGEQSRVGEEE